ncbi:hypothetical protein Y017_02770 [Alcanivorax sp. 97CO-5]|uniref:Ig-like domain-containing protein n=1 Tax=unclassified Alcanivorax TaxID=2638842 RepID=UPI0003E7F645|nr:MULTISPECIES: Ig-like domain-containing protein [unclassified Alcanivorax]EUC68959.1 hypothetical protein Y017_02770 [Alcanivorax sp. 97CO-5]PKG01068.1 hypothetical protein Y019_10110 [Alcanivorax sp. 97CO-6]
MNEKKTNIYQLFTALLIATIASILYGCGGDDEGDVTTTTTWQAPDSLIFSYPYPDQIEVPSSAPVVLRFSTELDQEVIDDIDTRLLLVSDLDDSTVAVEYQVTDNGRGLVLHPLSPLLPAETYHLAVSGAGLGAIDGDSVARVQFSTAGNQGGAMDAMGVGPFALLSAPPLDQPQLLASNEDASRPNDMSTFRMSFNQTLDPTSTSYGENGTVQLRDNLGKLVPASMFMRGRYLTLDPSQDLEPVEHTLTITGLRAQTTGAELPEYNRTFVPISTLPRATSILKVGSLGAEQPDLTSALTGNPINQVPVQSFVLGNDSFTALSGDLAADLGFAPDFPGAVPLRVPAGSVLRGSPVDVNILGKIPSGLETGEVTITLLSDANGYLIPNPFSDSPSVPRYALLNMDAAMSAEGLAPNGALSQNLLNVQVAGLAVVEDGVLVLDAVSVVEPEVLGLERASGLLSFRMEAYENQRQAPSPTPDARPLELHSWVPGIYQPNARPGDPIILNFNKPLDPASVFLDGAVQITVDGVQLSSFPMRHDGATLVIGEDIIEHNKDIQVTLTSLLRDTQGNSLSQDQTLDIRLPDFDLPNDNPDELRAPLVAAVFPGYPCAMTNPILTGPRENWRNGRCTGGNDTDPLTPVSNLYKDFSLRAVFSRSIDKATINDNTFVVEHFNDNAWQPVAGRLQLFAQRAEFFPDSPWRIGDLYRFTLHSEEGTPNCGVNAICSTDGAAIQTRQISQSSSTAPGLRQGGPDLTNHFVVTGEDDRITRVTLRGLPTSDTNANLRLDDSEQGAVPDGNGGASAEANFLQLGMKDTSGVVSDANIGCSIGEDCPEKRFSFIGSGGLQAGVSYYDPDVVVNRRLIDGNPDTSNEITGSMIAKVYPTVLSTTSVFLEARALGLITIPLDTGPLVLRLQHENNHAITGYVSETPDGPWFSTSFDLMIDAPELEPRLLIELGHDLRSKVIKNVIVEGPLRFVEDGRLILKVRNPDPLVIAAEIDLLGIGLGGLELEVPPLGVDLTFTFLPVKNF